MGASQSWSAAGCHQQCCVYTIKLRMKTSKRVMKWRKHLKIKDSKQAMRKLSNELCNKIGSWGFPRCTFYCPQKWKENPGLSLYWWVFCTIKQMLNQIFKFHWELLKFTLWQDSVPNSSMKMQHFSEDKQFSCSRSVSHPPTWRARKFLIWAIREPQGNDNTFVRFPSWIAYPEHYLLPVYVAPILFSFSLW